MARRSKQKAKADDTGKKIEVEEVAAAEESASSAEEGAAVSEETEGEPDYKALYHAANDKWLRTKAELENYRRRIQREFTDIRAQTKMMTVQEFLSVYDHFQMAVEHAAQSTDVESLRQGLELIQGEFARTLENLGAVPFDAEGEPFDPELHEAMAQQPSDTVPAGHVLKQWKAGFRLGDRLLRPATVIVSSGAAEEGDDAESGKA